MKPFMVQIDLPDVFTPELADRIPAQKEMVDKLTREGVVQDYSLSQDRTRLWIILQAPSEGEVHDILDAFPIREFMDYEIIPLMLHVQAQTMPELSLN